MSEQTVLGKVKDLIGKEVGVSDWVKIDQERIDKFADCTEDFQWIHVDEERAAKGAFGKTIAHGFLTLSLIPRFASCVKLPLEGLKREMSINYGLNKVRFINPVPVGSNIRVRVVLKDAAEKSPGRFLFTYIYTFEIEGQEKPACVAEQLGMLVLKRE